MHGPSQVPASAPQHAVRYLGFFLRSRENSLAFFLWGRMGRRPSPGELWDVGLACPHPSSEPLTGGWAESKVSPNTQGP